MAQTVKIKKDYARTWSREEIVNIVKDIVTTDMAVPIDNYRVSYTGDHEGAHANQAEASDITIYHGFIHVFGVIYYEYYGNIRKIVLTKEEMKLFGSGSCYVYSHETDPKLLQKAYYEMLMAAPKHSKETLLQNKDFYPKKFRRQKLLDNPTREMSARFYLQAWTNKKGDQGLAWAIQRDPQKAVELNERFYKVMQVIYLERSLADLMNEYGRKQSVDYHYARIILADIEKRRKK